MNLLSSVADQPLAEVTRLCQHETARYREGLSSDGRYCLEIFRRALAQVQPAADQTTTYADEEAREVLTRLYTPFIQAQIRRDAVWGVSNDDLIQQIWLQFWQAARSGLDFPTLPAALSYIKLTAVRTVIMLRRRDHQRQREESFAQQMSDEGDRDFADDSSDIFDNYTRQRFRARCYEILTDPLERRVFWMCYSMGRKPKSVAADLAREGITLQDRLPTARRVSDLLDKSFRRLERDQEIIDLLGGD